MRKTLRKTSITLVACGFFAGYAAAQQTPSATTPAPAAQTPATQTPATKTPAAKTAAPPASGATPTARSQTGSAATATPGTKTSAPKTGTAAKPGTAAHPAFTLKTDKEKQSYAIGLNIGRNIAKELQSDGVNTDPAILARAIKDVLSGAKPLLTDDEVKNTMTALMANLTKEMEQKNKSEGDAFLAANKTKDGVVTLPSGLQYKVLKEGTGPKPTATDSVICNYKGTLLNGTEFDNSYKRGQPVTFPVGHVIPGWTEALQLMPVGSTWQLFIPSDLAYGLHPPQRSGIQPNSTLVFEVELVSIKPPTEAPAGAAGAVAPPPPGASPRPLTPAGAAPTTGAAPTPATSNATPPSGAAPKPPKPPTTPAAPPTTAPQTPPPTGKP